MCIVHDLPTSQLSREPILLRGGASASECAPSVRGCIIVCEPGTVSGKALVPSANVLRSLRVSADIVCRRAVSIFLDADLNTCSICLKLTAEVALEENCARLCLRRRCSALFRVRLVRKWFAPSCECLFLIAVWWRSRCGANCSHTQHTEEGQFGNATLDTDKFLEALSLDGPRTMLALCGLLSFLQRLFFHWGSSRCALG